MVPGRTCVEGLCGMSDDADDPPADRRNRHERRADSVSAPYGPRALTGADPGFRPRRTPRFADYPEGRIPAVPGCRCPADAPVAPAGVPEDSVHLAGEPSAGEVVPAADEAPPAPSRSFTGGRRLAAQRRAGPGATGAVPPDGGPPGPRGPGGLPVRSGLRPARTVPSVRPGSDRPGGRCRRTDAPERPRRRTAPSLSEVRRAARGVLLTAVDAGGGGLRAAAGGARGGRPALASVSPRPVPRPGFDPGEVRKGLDNGRFQPEPTVPCRLRRPVHLPLPAARHHAAPRSGRGGAAAERRPCRPVTDAMTLPTVLVRGTAQKLALPVS